MLVAPSHAIRQMLLLFYRHRSVLNCGLANHVEHTVEGQECVYSMPL